MGDMLRSTPMLWVLLFTLGGIVAGCCGGVWIVLIIILALTGSVALNIKGHRFIAMLLGGAMMCGVASWYVDWSFNRFTAPVDAAEVQVTGTVERVSESERSIRLLVNLSGKYRGSCYVRVVRSFVNFRPGDIVKFTAELQPPVVRRDIDSEDLMERFYFFNHVGATATVAGDNIDVTGVNNSPLWRLRRFKKRIVDVIACTSLNASTQGFLTALLTGDDSMLFDDTRSRFASAGIAHVLALSGLHVAVIAMILGLCLFPLTWLGYHRLRSVGIVFLLWCYAIMTGLSPSVVRAVLMFTLIILARYTGRRYSSLNALCFAAFLIAIVDPRCIFSAGYQLTLVATASLIVIPRVIEIPREHSTVYRWLQSYMLYTVAAFVGTLLLSVYWFNQAPLFFLFTNLPCMLLIPFILTLGIFVIVLQAVGLHWGLPITVEDFMCKIIDYTASLNTCLAGSVVDNMYLPAWSVWIGYAALVAVIASIYYRKLLYCSLGVMVIIGIFCIPLLYRPGDTLFVSRTGEATTLVFNHGSKGFIVTTAKAPDIEIEKERIGRSYPLYMKKCGIREFISLNRDGVGIYEMEFGDKRLVIINDNDVPESNLGNVDYLIVGSGYKGNVTELAEAVPCDTILLGTDIHGRRRHRYCKELIDAGQCVRDLGEPYGLVLKEKH